MDNGLPKLMGATMLMLLMSSFLVAAPVRAAGPPPGVGEIIAPPYAVPAESVWATVNAVPQGNYPGGNLEFDVFVVNSDQPPDGNVTLFNETLTASALPPGSQTNTGIGLPVSLAPGQAILSTIYLEIPNNFTQSNFTANLVADVSLWNGTANIPLKLTGSAQVFLLGLPVTGTQTTTSSTSRSSQTAQTTTQSGTVSTTLFAAGVAIPSIVVVILLIFLVRGRGRPKAGP